MVLLRSAIGYCVSRMFSISNPISAAIYNGTAELTHKFSSRIFRFFRLSPFDNLFLSSGLSIAAGCYATNYVADKALLKHVSKITLTEGIKISALSIASEIALVVGLISLVGTVVCIGAGVAAISNKLSKKNTPTPQSTNNTTPPQAKKKSLLLRRS